MVRSTFPNTSINSMTYKPPPLPEYLSRSHALNVIIGAPTEEEVRAIHDAIRAVNSVSNFPALYDHKLSTQLAQHLFTVQMAIYRSEYPSSIFPGENTYTPPTIPSHIPISLEPVVGAPSDEELESAHGVVRAMENLANSPFFESGLSAKLSQHLFNLQFARYIQDSNQGQFVQKPVNPPPQENNNDLSPLEVVGQHELQAESSVGPLPSTPNPPQEASLEHTTPESAPNPHLTDNTNPHYPAQQLEETNRLLKVISRTLISTYFTVHRGPGQNTTAYKTINEKGELPWMHHLPEAYCHRAVSLFNTIKGQDLVGYLKFYDIGAEMIEESYWKPQDGQGSRCAEATRMLFILRSSTCTLG